MCLDETVCYREHRDKILLVQGTCLSLVASFGHFWLAVLGYPNILFTGHGLNRTSLHQHRQGRGYILTGSCIVRGTPDPICRHTRPSFMKCTAC